MRKLHRITIATSLHRSPSIRKATKNYNMNHYLPHDLKRKEGIQKSTQKGRVVHTINHILYVVVTTLCIFMVFWILIFPSSLLHEHSPIHQNLLRQWFHSMSGSHYIEVGAVSSDLITKYRGQYLVQVTHIFPGAIWAAIIPFQLNTQFRKKHRRLHRYSGYMLTSTSLILGTGVFIILYKRLLYENFFPDLPPVQVSSSPGLTMLTIYFMGTILMALYHATITKNYYNHSIWITRHIASGLWIALQRILLGSPLFNQPPMTREQQRSAFGRAALVAMAASLILCEILISVWNYEQSKILTPNASAKAM
jgi:multisubunit Na+/H+ antiporter MnhB subunit